MIESEMPELIRQINVEVVKEKSSTIRREYFETQVTSFLYEIISSHAPIKFNKEDLNRDQFLYKNVESITVVYCDDGIDNGSVDYRKCALKIHLYQLNEAEEFYEEEIEHDDETVVAADNWVLPYREFDNLWESLVYNGSVKSDLLNYAYSALLFTETAICQTVVSWNKIVLLHGPPGTGKTSLCRALAHKLSIRLSDRYNFGHLIEINSHSLFSKWFSESGKLVAKMMKKIFDYVHNENSIVFVLIDEIESLTSMRQAALSGNEPSDAIRVVNSLLTQLDKIKKYPNVFILTTSNITEAIDTAFLDRADIRLFIDNPTSEAVYCILKSCLIELMNKKIIQPSEQLLSQRALNFMEFADTKLSKASLMLWTLSKKCSGLSGRTLRKLPFLAHARYLRKISCNTLEFLEALDKQVDYLKQESQYLVKM